MPLRPDYEPAVGISIAGIDARPYGSIVVRLHDATGAIFASASIGPATADRLLAQLTEHVGRQRAGGLGAIRCEGSA